MNIKSKKLNGGSVVKIGVHVGIIEGDVGKISVHVGKINRIVGNP